MSHWVTKFSNDLAPDMVEIFSRPDALVEQGSIIKDDKSTTVAKYKHNNQQFIIKRFNARNSGHAVKRSLRKSRARNCWDISDVFLKSGLLVAQPIAVLETRFGILKGNSYFVSNYINGDELLHWLPKQDSSMQSLVAKKIQEAFIILSEKRIAHGDMKATNLLWSETHQNIVFIDLDVAKQHKNQLLFERAHLRDKRRFSRNGDFFKKIISENN